MTLLEVLDVSVRSGGMTALDRASFVVGESDIGALIGPHWARKTTLFTVISTAFMSRRSGRFRPVVEKGLDRKHSGFNDAYLNEGGRMAVYEVEDPTQLGTFVPDGEVIDNVGGIGNDDDVLAGGRGSGR